MSEDILSKRQIEILVQMGRNPFLSKTFYLTGGTALAAFYLQHRYSEDLDFFSEQEFDVLGIDIFFKQLKDKLGIKSIDFQQNLNRNLFFLNFGGEVVKTEFTFFPFPRIETGKKEYGLRVESLKDIAVNKLFTIYQRIKARDYIDLFLICKDKGFSVTELVKLAKAKFDWHIDPIQLAGQFVKARNAEDYPRMIQALDNEAWQNFFEEEAKKLKPEILTT